LFGAEATKEAARTQVQSLVKDKQWLWRNDYKMPNGVHVYGRRHNPFGPDNYPYEIKKIRQMGMIRDTAIWMALRGEAYDIAAADAKTYSLPAVETNYTLNGDDPVEYLYDDKLMETFTVADGYELELFASERDFPELANPCQISFDNKGRLWVASMPTYPHYKPGDARPDDKLIILEDTDKDGKADKSTVFADDLHVPVGFELAPEGVYVSQGTNLVLLKDTDGDDQYDEKEIIFSGFDDHDTHHTTSAFTTDPSGAIIMCEGLFLHTNVETPYGPVRATDGGFYRFAPRRRHLERMAQIAIPNPGFLGAKQFNIEDDGVGYKTTLRHDLVSSTDQNFRPVDLEFAPDGSLYIADWHNVLVGHMQHNARDPLRDHVHGRIYRITYPGRPLVEPAVIDGAPITTLLDNLKLPEYRSRYRSQRELRGRPASEVIPAAKAWVAGLDQADPNYESWLLEGLWATWGQNRWVKNINDVALKHLTGEGLKVSKANEIIVTHLRGKELEQFAAGWDIYHEDGSCITCHQKNGKGLRPSGFPPLMDSEWVLDDPKVLAKILLKGMIGPVTVNDWEYPGQVPMTPYENILDDEEMAAVMTYVRNAFSNRASAVTAEFVAKVRAEVEASGHEGYYRAEDLRPASR